MSTDDVRSKCSAPQCTSAVKPRVGEEAKELAIEMLQLLRTVNLDSCDPSEALQRARLWTVMYSLGMTHWG